MSNVNKKAIELTPEQIDAAMVDLLREEPMSLMTYFIVIMGREAVSVNAENMKLSTECDISGNRYKVTAVIKAKKIKQ